LTGTVDGARIMVSKSLRSSFDYFLILSRFAQKVKGRRTGGSSDVWKLIKED
jgi:hypothetical protein